MFGFFQFFKDLMHSIWGFARFAIYEQAWNGPPSTLPLQYSFGPKGTATGINLWVCLLLTSALLCHRWRLDSHNPFIGEKNCRSGKLFCLIFLTTISPPFPKFQMYCQIYFSFLSQTTLFLPSQSDNLSLFVITNYLKGIPSYLNRRNRRILLMVN